jgi:thiol-disulfide isomerase/thioredoxin
MKRRTLLLSGALLSASLVLPRRARATIAKGLIIADPPVLLPALDIQDGDGNAAGLALLRGRAVLLNLWASWCLPCVVELPSLDRLAPVSAADGIDVVALSLDRTGAPAARAAYARMGIKSLALRLDAERRAAEALAATMLPTTLLIDARGREMARFVGAAEWDSPQARPLLRALAEGRKITADLAPPPARSGGAQPP